MAALGFYIEETPLFGEVAGIEPISYDEADNIDDGFALQKLLYDNNSSFGTGVASTQPALKEPPQTSSWHNTSPWAYPDGLSGSTSPDPDVLSGTNPPLSDFIPQDLNEALAELVSIFEHQDMPLTLSDSDVDAFNSFSNEGSIDQSGNTSPFYPSGTQSPFDELSSYSGYSTAFEMENESVTSPSSLGIAESFSASPSPSFYVNDMKPPTPEEFTAYDVTKDFYPDNGHKEFSVDEFFASVPEQGKSRRAKATHRHKPYSSSRKVVKLDELEPTERAQRKKDQNKNAASKYRMKKKAEKRTLDDERQELEEQNIELKKKVGDLTKEIQYIKGLMKEVMQAKKSKSLKGKP